jgi:hypothetical protein
MTDDGGRIETLLTEIRDAQRDLVTEYRRVANESLAIQREAFEAQRTALAQQKRSIEAQMQYGRIYRLAMLVILPLIGFVVWLIFRILPRI